MKWFIPKQGVKKMTKKYKKFINRGKPTNIAEKMAVVFKRLPYDDETDTIVGLRKFRRELNRKGGYIEECPESCDSSRIYTFRDGSRAKLGNPCQEAFTAFFYTIKKGA